MDCKRLKLVAAADVAAAPRENAKLEPRPFDAASLPGLMPRKDLSRDFWLNSATVPGTACVCEHESECEHRVHV